MNQVLATNFDNHLKIRHGSQDSLDKDVYLILDAPVSSLQSCKEICECFPHLNVNLAVIANQKVVWCYKGTIDEVNNSIYYTFNLHEENKSIGSCPVVLEQNRNLKLKIDRTIRGVLSYLSRTQWRAEVKQALKSDSLQLKLNTLSLIDLRDIESFGKKGTNIEVYKFLCFQLVQTCMLCLGNEVFTKQDVRDLFPSLESIINREEDPDAAKKLQNLLDSLIAYTKRNYL